MMSLTHLLLLLAATFLAGVISPAIGQEKIVLDSEYQVNTHFFYDDSVLLNGLNIVLIKMLIEKLQGYFENGLDPSVKVNVTGLSYLRGRHKFG